MGLSDRDYYSREEQPMGYQMRRPQSMIIKIVIVNVAFFVANFLFGGKENAVTNFLSLNSDTLLHPTEWWKFLTCGFAHSPGGLQHIGFNMLSLWFLGQDVERRYGSNEFLRIYLIALVLGSVFWSATHFNQVTIVRIDDMANSSVVSAEEVPADATWLEIGDPKVVGAYYKIQPQLLGASGAVTAIVMLFVFNFPKRMLLLMFVIPVPAWVVGVLIIAVNVFAVKPVSTDAAIAYDVHLVGAAVAAIYFYGKLDFGRMWPSQWSGLLKSRPKLRVVAPEDYERAYRQQDDEADRILQKLHQQGEGSLTSRERKILEEYSRRMRQKHR